MKIAVVFDKFVYGGIERVGITYIKMLLQAGHSVDAYILSLQTEALADEIPAECHVIRRRFSSDVCPEWAWTLAEQQTGRRLLSVFAGSYMANSVRARLLRRRLTVSDRHYDIAIAFSGHIRDLTFVAEGYVQADHKLAWMHGAQYQYALTSPAFFRLYPKIKNFVCLSELCDAECTKYNLLHGIRKRKIYNPCHIPVIRPGEKLPDTVDENKVRALREEYGDFCVMVARLAEDKDQETVLYAMKDLRERYGLKKKLLLVGDGPKHAGLEALAAELGMADDVIFTGTRADVQNYYLAAHIYVHASDLEGLPTVFLEAMACGLPVVSDDAIPGAREILQDGKDGLITPVRDHKQLADSLYRLYTDEALRQKLIEKGYRRLEAFSETQISAQLEEYLREIVGD